MQQTTVCCAAFLKLNIMAEKKTKDDVFRKFFPHFSLRLSERYGILITFEEYANLCALYLQRPKFEAKDNRPPIKTGYLKIHGVEVKVMKSTSLHKQLLTAIPHEDHFKKRKVNSRKFTKKRLN